MTAGRPNPFLQAVVRAAAVTDLLATVEGATLQATYKPGHFTLVLPLPMPLYRFRDRDEHNRRASPAYTRNQAVFDALAGTFGPPVPNPVKGL